MPYLCKRKQKTPTKMKNLLPKTTKAAKTLWSRNCKVMWNFHATKKEGISINFLAYNEATGRYMTGEGQIDVKNSNQKAAWKEAIFAAYMSYLMPYYEADVASGRCKSATIADAEEIAAEIHAKIWDGPYYTKEDRDFYDKACKAEGVKSIFEK